MTERIGVFGGTFDPPHIEHLLAAAEARSQLELDRVLLMVAHRPWQKIGSRPITDSSVRFEMVRASVAGLDRLEASDVEVSRGGDSYTVDTLEVLRTNHPSAQFFVIVGADVEAMIPTWKDIDTVRAHASLVVVSRQGRGDTSGPEDDKPWRAIARVAIHRLDLSSTELRARVAAGENIDVLCPPGVVQVIRARNLYSGDSQ